MPPRYIRKLSEEKTFWITNVSNRLVSIGDLALHIEPYSSINLLDRKHYHLTQEQIDKSALSGSIFAKRDKIKVRSVPPPGQEKVFIPFDDKATIPSRKRSTVQINDIHYEELNISDDNYAEDNAETSEADRLNNWQHKGK